MLRATVSQYFQSMQRNLFPDFAEELGVTTDKHLLQVIIALDVIQVENFLPTKAQMVSGDPYRIAALWRAHSSQRRC